MAQFKDYPGIFVEGLKKNHKKISSPCPDRVSNQAPPECKSEVLSLQSTCFVFTSSGVYHMKLIFALDIFKMFNMNPFRAIVFIELNLRVVLMN
jgi:hypothetical protein